MTTSTTTTTTTAAARLVELDSRRSTNGRWGLALIGPADLVGPEGRVAWPIRGTLADLGEIDHMRTVVITPDPAAQTWIWPADDATAITGATVIAVDLQSNEIGSIIVAGPVAVVKHRGYKGRSSETVLYRDGVPEKLSAPVLAAMGLLPAPRQEAVEAPPADTAMAEALRRAGLLPAD